MTGLILSCISALNHEILRYLCLSTICCLKFERSCVADSGCHSCPERAIERFSLNSQWPACTLSSVFTVVASIICAVQRAAITIAFISWETRISWYVIVVTEYFVRLLHTLRHRHFYLCLGAYDQE